MEKQKKKTREELAIENAEMKKTIERLLSLDEVQRVEFAKAFYWKQTNEPSRYGSYNVSSTGAAMPSWSQIFVEIGKLLACRDFRDFEGNISELKCAVEEIKKHEEKNNPTS